MNDSSWEKQIIWITGASTGIGRALVHHFLAQGAIVIGSARHAVDLCAVSDADTYLPIPVDITDSKQLAEAAKQINAQFGKLDILIANAGICEYVDMPDFDTAVIERVMHVNYVGTVRTIAAALPLLRRATRPYLLCMASSNAYLGLPRSQAYGPSKSAIYNLMQSMKADLADEMDVSVICPGFVESPLTAVNDFPMPARITAQAAANYITKGMKRRRFDIHFPKRFTLPMRLLACLPDGLIFKLTSKLSRRKS